MPDISFLRVIQFLRVINQFLPSTALDQGSHLWGPYETFPGHKAGWGKVRSGLREEGGAGQENVHTPLVADGGGAGPVRAKCCSLTI